MTDVLRFIGGVLFLALASLTALPVPTQLLWTASLAASEWGYWLAFPAVLPLIPTRHQTPLGRLGAVLSAAAIVLFVMPVIRANQLNHDLPAAFDGNFGTARRARAEFAEDPQPDPFTATHLFRPVQSRPIRFEERVFATYGGQKLTLDVYRPGYLHEAVPCVIVVHGGTWQSGDNSEFVALNAYLAARDYVVVAINYRLSPQWPFPAARDDVLSAMAYLKVYAGELGIDPARIALLGRAGGGQLALLAAYTAQDPSVRGVISVYGPTDLRFEYEHPAPRNLLETRRVLETYLGGSPQTAADAYFTASPINFVSASSPPTLLIHGSHDAVVPPEESARLDARLQEAGVKHLFVKLSWATHRCDKSFGGPCGQVATYAIERFLDGVTAVPTAPAAPQRKTATRTSPLQRASVARR
jgi:acetyl esterase/lipase